MAQRLTNTEYSRWDNYQSQNCRVAYSNGDGTFQEHHVSGAAAAYHNSITTGYLNDDEFPDVVASVWSYSYLDVYINTGARSGWSHQRIDGAGSIMPPQIIDVDGLYGNDIVTKQFSSQQWRIHKSNHATNAQFSAVYESFSSQVGSTDVRTSGQLDFDSDGKMDMVLGDTSRYVQIYRNQYGEAGGRHFSNNAALYQNVGFSIYFMDIGDVNNDGVDDIVVGGNGAAYILCNGDGTWENKVGLTGPSVNHDYGGIKIFDVDG